MGRKSKKKKERLRVFAVAIFFALLSGEVFVRLMVGGPLRERLPIMTMQANPYRGYEMVPGKDHYTYHHLVRINELGLRGEEIGPKAPGELRVLALGDSLVYGQGVGEDETLPHYLAEALAATDPGGRTWSVVNAGHRAYDTRQELGLLEELGPAIDPDVVVLFWFWNDLRERDIELTNRNLTRLGELAFDTGSRVEGWERVKWQTRQVVRASALVMFLYDAVRRPGYVKLAGEEADLALARQEEYLDRLAGLAVQRRFVPLVCVIPEVRTLVQEHWARDLELRFGELARERGLPVVDLHGSVAELFEETGELPVIPFDGHYLPDANAAMARAVAGPILSSVAAARKGGS